MPIEPPFKDLFQPGFVRSSPAFRYGFVALERLNRLRAVAVLQVDAENGDFGHAVLDLITFRQVLQFTRFSIIVMVIKFLSWLSEFIPHNDFDFIFPLFG
jgi:hypothetical protein